MHGVYRLSFNHVQSRWSVCVQIDFRSHFGSSLLLFCSGFVNRCHVLRAAISMVAVRPASLDDVGQSFALGAANEGIGKAPESDGEGRGLVLACLLEDIFRGLAQDRRAASRSLPRSRQRSVRSWRRAAFPAMAQAGEGGAGEAQHGGASTARASGTWARRLVRSGQR